VNCYRIHQKIIEFYLSIQILFKLYKQKCKLASL